MINIDCPSSVPGVTPRHGWTSQDPEVEKYYPTDTINVVYIVYTLRWGVFTLCLAIMCTAYELQYKYKWII